jgi:hypothetical protein
MNETRAELGVALGQRQAQQQAAGSRKPTNSGKAQASTATTPRRP